MLALAVSGSNIYAGGWNYVLPSKWDGSTWSTLGSGRVDFVRALAVVGHDVYAGVAFISAGGVTATNIAKWDGTAWSALGSGLNDVSGLGGNANVKALAVSGSDLFVGGSFTIAGGKASPYLARWNLAGFLPRLSMLRSSANVTVSWPSFPTGFILEQKSANASNWAPISVNVTEDATNKSATFLTTNEHQFFRLRKP